MVFFSPNLRGQERERVVGSSLTVSLFKQMIQNINFTLTLFQWKYKDIEKLTRKVIPMSAFEDPLPFSVHPDHVQGSWWKYKMYYLKCDFIIITTCFTISLGQVPSGNLSLIKQCQAHIWPTYYCCFLDCSFISLFMGPNTEHKLNWIVFDKPLQCIDMICLLCEFLWKLHFELIFWLTQPDVCLFTAFSPSLFYCSLD